MVMNYRVHATMAHEGEGCAPPGTPFADGASVPSLSSVARYGLAFGQAFIGSGISNVVIGVGWSIAGFVVGIAAGLLRSKSLQGHTFVGLVYAAIVVVAFGGFVQVRGGVQSVDDQFGAAGLEVE